MKKTEKVAFRRAFSNFRRAVSLTCRKNSYLLFSLLLSQILTAATPYVTVWFSAQILNELAGERDVQRLTRLVILTLAITCVLSLCKAAAQRWYSHRFIMKGWQNDRILHRKMLEMDFSILDRQSTYALRSSILQARNWAGRGLGMAIDQLEFLVLSVAKIIGALALSVGLFTASVPHRGDWLDVLSHPLAPLAVLLAIGLLTALSSFLQIKATQGDRTNAEASLLGNRIFSYFGFAVPDDRKRQMDVRLYEQCDVCINYFSLNSTFTWDGSFGRWQRGLHASYQAGAGFVQRLTAFPIYVYACLLAWAGAFGIGSVSQYVAAVTSLFDGISTLLEQLADMRTNAPFLEDVFRLLDLPNEMYQGSLTTEKRSDRQYEVEFRDVSFRYPDTDAWALRHVNLKFQIGRRLAVVGENGSGKTTFIKLLCRLYDPTEGEILLNGINIRKYSYQDYLALFSVVFQDFQLLPLPLGQNVAAAKQYDPARAADCLEKAGFAGRLAEMPKGLETSLYRTFDPEGVEVSGGEGQKIALARALYRDAPFIILDEPTAALDPLAEAEVYSKFDQIAGDKTAVYISHRLSSCRFCDDIAVFHQGQVVQKGSHESLLADKTGKYAALWNAQAQYYAKNPEAAPAE